LTLQTTLLCGEKIMPVCKYCGLKITNQDFDICPHCGEKDPIDAKYKTKDITSFVDPVTGEALYKSKTKKKAGLFEMFLGSFGVCSFYLGYKMKGIVSILVTLIIVGGLGTVFFFVVPGLAGNVLSYIIPFAAVFLFHVGCSLKYFIKPDIKGADGELLI